MIGLTDRAFWSPCSLQESKFRGLVVEFDVGLEGKLSQVLLAGLY